jgi:uncharacterized C2H2 Zn-finger protein
MKNKECPHCGKMFSNKGIGSHIWKAHGEGKSPAWNKGLTKETSDVVKRNSLSLSEYNKRNGVKPPSWKGRKHTKDAKKKISMSMVGNTNSPGRGKISYHKGIKMKSSWESKTAEYFDVSGLTWKYEEQCYPLTDNTTYRPDFFIYDGCNLVKIVEVKGYFRKENREKFELFKKMYPEIVIELWDKKVLKEKRII